MPVEVNLDFVKKAGEYRTCWAVHRLNVSERKGNRLGRAGLQDDYLIQDLLNGAHNGFVCVDHLDGDKGVIFLTHDQSLNERRFIHT